MNKLTLKHLRYFDALARFKHFGKAARHCAISQPALSVQIKDLEEILGACLVERGARQITLTGLGLSFAKRTREVLLSVDELVDLARCDSGDLIGELRIGIIPTIAPYLLPALVKELAIYFPGFSISPREAMTHKLIEGLKEGQLDTAILALPVSESSLTEQRLFDEEFVLVRPTKDKDKPAPSPDKLSEMRLLLLEEGHCFRDQALSFCNAASALPREIMEGNSLSTLVQMVGAGIGVTLIPDMAIEVETRSAPVCVARLGHPRPVRTIGMVWRKTSPLCDELIKISKIISSLRTDKLS